MSIDGFIDDVGPQRLLLSNSQDFDRADAVRADCDAILVGAGTIRADDPSLLVKSRQRQLDRKKRGLPQQPTKITLTRSGNIPTNCKFLLTGDNEKLVFCTNDQSEKLCRQLEKVSHAHVIALSDMSPQAVLDDLYNRGVKRVLVEGGSAIATSFLAADCVDELQISIAPFFIGEPGAARFANPACFPARPDRPMQLQKVEQFDQVVLLTYILHASVLSDRK